MKTLRFICALMMGIITYFIFTTVFAYLLDAPIGHPLYVLIALTGLAIAAFGAYDTYQDFTVAAASTTTAPTVTAPTTVAPDSYDDLPFTEEDALEMGAKVDNSEFDVEPLTEALGSLAYGQETEQDYSVPAEPVGGAIYVHRSFQDCNDTLNSIRTLDRNKIYRVIVGNYKHVYLDRWYPGHQNDIIVELAIEGVNEGHTVQILDERQNALNQIII